ncbi:hypothetical protein LMG8526HA_02199 [Lactococcus lactis]|uniref:DUF1655 domain-containing protein n=1 Tax=Lactococcus lactis TaxID=1358 RepID=UPI00071E4814|nr:DUF1655 domain-containing protein [Lactococcus lactis]KSU12542.1 hypothetical protein LMG8526_0523 [Lactococcus lactis subsp. lactis]MDU0401311.1 hypothetical protein [Lactococcus lactis]
MKETYYLPDTRALDLMKQVKAESKYHISMANAERFFDKFKNIVTFKMVSNGYIVELVRG